MVRNPLTVGSLLGVLLSATGVRLPMLVANPLELIGGMAVPAMLLAYGVSLRLGPRPGTGEPAAQIAVLAALKLIAQPVVATVIGCYVLGLAGLDLLAVAIIAALPTAQNVFTHAVRYDTGVLLARDTIFVSTVLSVPALLLIAAWLG